MICLRERKQLSVPPGGSSRYCHLKQETSLLNLVPINPLDIKYFTWYLTTLMAAQRGTLNYYQNYQMSEPSIESTSSLLALQQTAFFL